MSTGLEISDDKRSELPSITSEEKSSLIAFSPREEGSPGVIAVGFILTGQDWSWYENR